MVELETNQKQSNIRPDLAKLLAKKDSLSMKALKQFTEKKRKEGIDVDEAIKENDLNIIIELSRYQSEYSAMNLHGPLPSDIKYESIDVNGAAAELIINPNVSEHQIFMHLFSGGYVIGTLKTRRRIPVLIGRSSHLRCLNVGYRLAPEHPFPAALEDSIKAYQWILSSGIESKNVIISGASAGGGLAVATVLKLKELKLPLPSAMILISPWADLALRGGTLKKNAKFEPNITIEMLKMLANAYLQGKDPMNSLVSPVYASLEGFPPMLIQVGSYEVLLDDSVRLTESAKAAGVDITLEIYEGMIHMFQNFVDILPDSRQAIENIAKFIEKYLN
ncbi:MAG: alpha/beta hydrolase [Promethearchaeota archaeon]|nr:MAG: alpha/beta hydrolase [Candidatus Lokiarchaeota archaeon]